MRWLDLFAGHGVGIAMRNLGIEEVAVEKWQDAIDSRIANGLSEPAYRDAWDIEAAGKAYDFDGIWASPPCQTFSTAGSGSGRRALDEVVSLVRENVWKSPVALRNRTAELEDDRTGLVLTPLAYAYRYRPAYLVLEQVVPVRPVWESFVAPLEEMGYSVWTGVLDASDYGVPQTRRRAYLIARDDNVVAAPPEPTGCGSLADIRPDQEGLISNYSSGSGGIVVPGNKKPRGYRRIDEPAFTVTGKVRANRWYPSMQLVSPAEALQMQSYPADFVVKGNWSLQIGNAVPPKVAEAVLSMF